MILKKVTFFSKRLYAFLLFFLTLEKLAILLLCTMYTYYIRDSFMVSLSLSDSGEMPGKREQVPQLQAGGQPTLGTRD
jgi:hypothetical protein